MDEVKKRDLRADLLAAEAEARAKKRKAAGLPVEDVQPASAALEDEEANKRRKVLQEALEMDKDADSDEGDGEGESEGTNNLNGNAKCVMEYPCVLVLTPSTTAETVVGEKMAVMTTMTTTMTKRTTLRNYFVSSRR